MKSAVKRQLQDESRKARIEVLKSKLGICMNSVSGSSLTNRTLRSVSRSRSRSRTPSRFSRDRSLSPFHTNKSNNRKRGGIKANFIQSEVARVREFPGPKMPKQIEEVELPMGDFLPEYFEEDFDFKVEDPFAFFLKGGQDVNTIYESEYNDYQ